LSLLLNFLKEDEENFLLHAGSVEKIAFFDASGLYTGPVEKWEGNDKNLRNWPKIKWPIYIINH